MNPPPEIDQSEFKKRMAKIYTFDTKLEQITNEKLLKLQANNEVKILKAELHRKELENKKGCKDPIKRMRSNIRAGSIYEEFNDYIANIKSNEK